MEPMNENMSLPTTFSVDPDGREEAKEFALTLLLEATPYETFQKWPLEKQAQYAEGIAQLGVSGLIKALRYLARYQCAHGEALQRFAEAKFGRQRN